MPKSEGITRAPAALVASAGSCPYRRSSAASSPKPSAGTCACTGLLAIVGLGGLALRLRLGGWLALAEQHLHERQRQLVVVAGEPLALLADDSPLELAAQLKRLEIELLVLVALGDPRRLPPLQHRAELGLRQVARFFWRAALECERSERLAFLVAVVPCYPDRQEGRRNVLKRLLGDQGGGEYLYWDR